MRPQPLFFTALALFTLAGSASADDNFKDLTDANGQKVYFKDDVMDGKGLNEHTATILVRPGAARQVLLRPRTHFIPEMLKTVENL
jgi:hypothetical protein